MNDLIDKLHEMIMAEFAKNETTDQQYLDMVAGVVKTKNMVVIPPFDNGMMGFVPVVVYIQGDRAGVINPNAEDADRTFEMTDLDEILSAAMEC